VARRCGRDLIASQQLARTVDEAGDAAIRSPSMCANS